MDRQHTRRSSPSASPSPAGATTKEMAAVTQLVLELCDVELRENALLKLSSQKKAVYDVLAPLLWNSYGTIAALLQEIVSVYPSLSSPNLSLSASNRVSSAIILLQCVASHPETRIHFLNAQMPLYLYPILETTSKGNPFQHLRISCLGVIGALVKEGDPEVIASFLRTEIISLSLCAMENGNEISRTVAAFIIHKILRDEVGLHYICARAELYHNICTVLGDMVAVLAGRPSLRMLKHIILCYLNLSENQSACESLQKHLPKKLSDGTLNDFLDADCRKLLERLFHNLDRGCFDARSSWRSFYHLT